MNCKRYLHQRSMTWMDFVNKITVCTMKAFHQKNATVPKLFKKSLLSDYSIALIIKLEVFAF